MYTWLPTRMSRDPWTRREWYPIFLRASTWAGIARSAFGQVDCSFLPKGALFWSYFWWWLLTQRLRRPNDQYRLVVANCTQSTVQKSFSYYLRSSEQVIKLREGTPCGTEWLDVLPWPAPYSYFTFITWLQSTPVRTMLCSQPFEVIDLIPHI